MAPAQQKVGRAHCHHHHHDLVRNSRVGVRGRPRPGGGSRLPTTQYNTTTFTITIHILIHKKVVHKKVKSRINTSFFKTLVLRHFHAFMQMWRWVRGAGFTQFLIHPSSAGVQLNRRHLRFPTRARVLRAFFIHQTFTNRCCVHDGSARVGFTFRQLTGEPPSRPGGTTKEQADDVQTGFRATAPSTSPSPSSHTTLAPPTHRERAQQPSVLGCRRDGVRGRAGGRPWTS